MVETKEKNEKQINSLYLTTIEDSRILEVFMCRNPLNDSPIFAVKRVKHANPSENHFQAELVDDENSDIFYDVILYDDQSKNFDIQKFYVEVLLNSNDKIFHKLTFSTQVDFLVQIKTEKKFFQREEQSSVICFTHFIRQALFSLYKVNTFQNHRDDTKSEIYSSLTPIKFLVNDISFLGDFLLCPIEKLLTFKCDFIFHQRWAN